MDPKLVYLVTLLGVVLSVFSFVVILRGRTLPGDAGAAHEVEFRGLRLKTSAVVMLLVVSVVVAVLPLVLQYRRLPRQEVHCPPERACPVAPIATNDCKVWLTGQVTDESSNPIEGAKVSVLRLMASKPGDPPVLVNESKTDASGTYDIPAFAIGEADRYRVVAEKKGFAAPRAIHMGPAGGVTLNAMLLSNKKVKGGTP